MNFIPAGEIIGDEHQVLKTNVLEGSYLPNGEYAFVDFYCTDPKCDCRKTIIKIYHDKKHVSTVNYGWEKPAFYAKWGKIDDQMSRDMSGLSIDFMSPDLMDSPTALRLMKALLDEAWIAKIQLTYGKIRKVLRDEVKASNVIRLTPKLSRNALCPCGSGVKFKRCCGLG